MSSSFPPSPFPTRWLPFVAFILAALGIPAATITLFTHFIIEHPLLSIIIGLIYEVILFIVSLIGKVWQRLENRWIDRIAEGSDHWVQGILSGYRKQYYQYLYYQHRDFDIKGLNNQGPYALELDQVFIELSIDPTTFDQMSPNPVPVPKVLRESSHSIWEYLTSAPLAKKNLTIIGPPGGGKTTLLKYITLSLLAPAKQRHYHHTKIPHKLPIILFLRDHANTIHVSEGKESPDFTLVDALHEHLKRWEQPEPPTGWVKRQLLKGRGLVMLDGLDEVSDLQVRQEVVNWVQRQMAAYSQNRFIVTSRPFGFRSNPLSGVVVLEVRPFTSEQVERFINKWYLANEIMRKGKGDAGVHMRARAEAKGLLQQLHDTPALLDLTVNPLLLTMITIVHCYGGGEKLPEKQVSLYADICKVFLGKRQEARGQYIELKPEQMQLVLEPLAYHMMKKGTREITSAEAKTVINTPLLRVSSHMSTEGFLKLVENVSGLLLEQENGVYLFAHKTFQEYLAATYIREKQLVQDLVARIEDDWWRESIRLYCAMTDATPIILACLRDNHPSVPALILAFDCQRDARDIQPEVRTRLESVLDQGVEDTDLGRQRVVAEVLLAQRLRQMVHLKENIFLDTSLITCAEYQLFLDEQRAQGKYYQPDHWKEYHFSRGLGHSPILGIRPSDAVEFCAWLTNRETGPWQYRLPKASELENAKGESISHQFPTTNGYWLSHENGSAEVREPVSRLHNTMLEAVSRDLTRDRFRARNRALGLDLAPARFRAFELASNLARPLTRALDHSFARDMALDQVSERTLAHERIRDLDLVLGFARVGDRIRTHDLARDLDHALDQSRDRARDYANLVMSNRALDLNSTLTLAHNLMSSITTDRKKSLILTKIKSLFFYSITRKREDDEIQHYIDGYLDIYITLVILEERINGRLPAWEGLLIMKERKV